VSGQWQEYTICHSQWTQFLGDGLIRASLCRVAIGATTDLYCATGLAFLSPNFAMASLTSSRRSLTWKVFFDDVLQDFMFQAQIRIHLFQTTVFFFEFFM
jgi:hypothetical protein